jgi:hypothetical protein
MMTMRMPTPTPAGRGWTLAAPTFAAGYGLLRGYWAAGGRWGYTACDRSADAAELTRGCGAEHLVRLPFWQGWGAVVLCGALAMVAALPILRPGRAAAVAAWTACAALVVMSFPALPRRPSARGLPVGAVVEGGEGVRMVVAEHS